eukprot:7391731-Prymnesium_polylepis.3
MVRLLVVLEVESVHNDDLVQDLAIQGHRRSVRLVRTALGDHRSEPARQTLFEVAAVVLSSGKGGDSGHLKPAAGGKAGLVRFSGCRRGPSGVCMLGGECSEKAARRACVMISSSSSSSGQSWKMRVMKKRLAEKDSLLRNQSQSKQMLAELLAASSPPTCER